MADVANMFSGGWYAAPSSTAVVATPFTDGVLIPGNALNKVPTFTTPAMLVTLPLVSLRRTSMVKRPAAPAGA